MINFELKIFLGLYDKAVEEAMKKTVLPNGIHAEFLLLTENKLRVPDNLTTVFITDKMSLLRSALALRKKNLHIVYCGHASDADKCLNRLEALWPAGESPDIVKKRFLILVKNLRNESDCWMWKQTFLTMLDETFPFPAALFSYDWKVVHMNREFEKISGNPAEVFDYHDWKQKMLLPVNQDITAGEVQEYKLDNNGKTRYFIVHEQAIRDCFENISGYLLTMQDITYQRACEHFAAECP